MREWIAGVIVTTWVGSMAAPAFAAHATGAHQSGTSIHVDGVDANNHDVHRHDSHGRHRIWPVPFGLESELGPDVTDAPSEAPSVDVSPLAPSNQAVDLPPCREIGAGGVVVLRGMGCARDKP
jgi:hypothetical protein